MKTFTTSGTGSQQTLSPIETDKIPVYDSVTDAVADLANLAENQIIATHDTGSELSAPVDVVQSGNMHAVTSNAVAESLSYSETEQKTGGKWIDGKPLYRRVVKYTNITIGSESTVIGTIDITNYDYIKLDWIGKNHAITIKYNGLLHLWLNESGGLSGLQTLASQTTGWDILVILEYTKTTD